MSGEFWDFASLLVREYGLLALIELVQAGMIFWLFRIQQKLEQERSVLQDKLLELSEKRLEDAREEREAYEELSRNLNKSIDLLIKAFRKKHGLNGDEG